MEDKSGNGILPLPVKLLYSAFVALPVPYYLQVYGLNDAAAQTWMPPLRYQSLLMGGLPLLVFWPTHWLLARLIPTPAERHKQATS